VQRLVQQLASTSHHGAAPLIPSECQLSSTAAPQHRFKAGRHSRGQTQQEQQPCAPPAGGSRQAASSMPPAAVPHQLAAAGKQPAACLPQLCPTSPTALRLRDTPSAQEQRFITRPKVQGQLGHAWLQAEHRRRQQLAGHVQQ
jgi:hypothetical protein